MSFTIKWFYTRKNGDEWGLLRFLLHTYVKIPNPDSLALYFKFVFTL